MVSFPDPRRHHPFHMHDMIRAQPRFVKETLDRIDPSTARTFLGNPRRLIVTGCGTSFHASLVGARLLQDALPEAVVHAIHAYDLVHGHGLPAKGTVLGVSHSGTTSTTNQAIAVARRSGLSTLGLCGLGGTAMAEIAEQTLVTGSVHDHSWANTMSYTTQLAAFARLAEAVAENPAELFPNGLEGLPSRVNGALGCEPQVRRLSRRVSLRGHLTIVGSELDEVTALEGALKIRETCSFPASGYHVEQFLHGPFLSLNSKESVVALRSKDDGDREAEILRSLARTGANVSTVGEAPDTDIRLPGTSPRLRPIVSVVPLQFLAYYVALARKANPDVMRSDVARYRLALEPMFASS